MTIGDFTVFEAAHVNDRQQPFVKAAACHCHLDVLAEHRIFALSVSIQREVQQALELDQRGGFGGLSEFRVREIKEVRQEG